MKFKHALIINGMCRICFTQCQIRNWNSGTPWLHSPGHAAFTMTGREAASVSQAGSVRSDAGACTHACPDAAVLLLNRTRCLCMPAHIRLKLPESRLYFDMLCHLDCMRAHVCACVFCSVWKARPSGNTARLTAVTARSGAGTANCASLTH